MERVEMHQHDKFCKNRSNRCKDIKIFRFFKMAGAAILNCRIWKILLADGVWRADTHNCTKFHQNRSFHYRDITIFRIFKMAVAAILDFRNLKILLVIGVERVETHQHASFFKIGQSVVNILKFFYFSSWRPPPSWIFEFVKFYWLTVHGPDTQLYQISSKLVVLLRRYCDFSNF